MKKALLIALTLLLTLVMAACQSTPQDSIVKGKNLDKMIDEATKPTASQTAAQGNNLAAKLGAATNYTKELVDAKGKVKIHVNANVVIPDAQSVSVQRVERWNFTQEQVDTLVKQLVKGELFSGDDFKMTKSEIQQKILEIQAAQSKLDPNSNESLNPKSGKQMMEYQLADLQEQLKTAPDTVTKTPITSKLVPMDMNTDYAKGDKLYALAQSDKGGYESLKIYNYADEPGNMIDYTSEKNAFSRNMGYFSTKEETQKWESQGSRPYITSQEIAAIPDIKMTEDEAKQKAEDLIKALGIDNLACYSSNKAYGGSNEMTADGSAHVNPRKCVWFLRYSRAVNGVPVTYTVWDCMKVQEEAQSSPWPYEDMTFAIDERGIVGFSWRSPYKITDTVTENSNLKSFGEITKIFDTMSLVVNAWEGLSEGNQGMVGAEITVDEMRLGLTRITEQNKRDSGLLVPCWDFMGSLSYIMERDGQKKIYVDGPIPILTVNAIDGSIINRSLGY